MTDFVRFEHFGRLTTMMPRNLLFVALKMKIINDFYERVAAHTRIIYSDFEWAIIMVSQ